jgi:DNA-binding MarR family transcriptional regulator
MVEVYDKTSREILLFLLKSEGKSINKMSLLLQKTYKQTHDAVNYLEKEGLIKTERGRRNRHLSLTEKGREVATLFERIDALLKKEVAQNV